MKPPVADPLTDFVDVVDFVERTTYAIWNDRRPDLIARWYGPHSTIWGNSGSVFGGEEVTEHSLEELAAFPDLIALVPDTIWTGDAASGYRTSMRWQASGTHTGAGPLGPATGRTMTDTCIANCVIVGDQYVEEWTVANGRALTDKLGISIDDAVRILYAPVTTPPESYRTAQEQGATVPAIPATVDGAGLFVQELLDGLYNQRDLSLVDRRYAAGAAYVFGSSRWQRTADGIRSEVARWLDLLPDLSLAVDELYWLDDAPSRSRVAVRYRMTGTAQVEQTPRPVSIMGIHHLHVRGGLVVNEWSEYDELALHAQLHA